MSNRTVWRTGRPLYAGVTRHDMGRLLVRHATILSDNVLESGPFVGEDEP